MKKTVLSINYQKFLLPEGANVNGILKILAGAKLLQRDPAAIHRDLYCFDESGLRIEVELVDSKCIREIKRA